jgi:hypothetical protein
MSVRRLLVGLACAYGLLAGGVLAGAETASAALPGSAGASWLSQPALMSGGRVLSLNGSSPRWARASSPVSSSASSGTFSARSFGASGQWVSSLATSGCDPSTWSEPGFSPLGPSLPYPACDPASYQVEVVQAVQDLRDVLVYGLGLLLLTSAASMVLLMRR